MARDDDVTDLDVVLVGADDGEDEELPQPAGGRERPPRGLKRRDLVIGAVVIAGAALITAAVRSNDGGTRTALPSRSAVPSETAAPPPIAPTTASQALVLPGRSFTGPGNDGVGSVDDPSICARADDGLSLCTTSTFVPSAFSAAVRAAFPGAVETSGLDENLRDVGYGSGGLWFRELRSRAGALQIVVQVHRKESSDFAQQLLADDGGESGVYIERITGTTAIEIQVLGPSGSAAPVAAAVRLSDDPRLLTPG